MSRVKKPDLGELGALLAVAASRLEAAGDWASAHPEEVDGLITPGPDIQEVEDNLQRILAVTLFGRKLNPDVHQKLTRLHRVLTELEVMEALALRENNLLV